MHVGHDKANQNQRLKHNHGKVLVIAPLLSPWTAPKYVIQPPADPQHYISFRPPFLSLSLAFCRFVYWCNQKFVSSTLPTGRESWRTLSKWAVVVERRLGFAVLILRSTTDRLFIPSRQRIHTLMIVMCRCTGWEDQLLMVDVVR